MERIALAAMLVAGAGPATAAPPWSEQAGKAGPSGWRCNVIQPDPRDDGPDGINIHDWDGDGDLDLFVNYEEGRYSRLFFNPGRASIRERWVDFIEFQHGPCEDSGIGDLDADGDIDYVANGGWVYFNPGREHLRDPGKWIRMDLFDEERRVPTVADLDGDGLNDLIVGAREWYRQPAGNKHDANHWERHVLGEAKWPMTCLVRDLDGDGDPDILVQERRKQGTFYYANPGPGKLTSPWPTRLIDAETEGMFLACGDVNGDGRDDLVKAAKDIRILLRTNAEGPPDYRLVTVPQPGQPAGVTRTAKPKGVAIMELNGDPSLPEILVIPEYAAQLWFLTASGDHWTTTLMDIPFPESRSKMDNAYPADLDGDGDLDVLTTEENGGWGVIWFENPSRK